MTHHIVKWGYLFVTWAFLVFLIVWWSIDHLWTHDNMIVAGLFLLALGWSTHTWWRYHYRR